MRDHSFSAFLVDDGNRRAYEVCLAVARAEPLSPMPVTLVAEPGCGKTHLLRAVANRLRASAGHAAIVFVVPGQRSDEITQLVEDPTPIDMARSAVLIIDDLDRFHDRAEELTRLVEIFLENDHAVLMAMSVHPDRTAHLPVPLRRIVRSGQLIEILPGEALKSMEAVEARVRQENQETIAELRRKLEELQTGGPEAAAERVRVRAAEFEKMRRGLVEAREEIEHLRAEAALTQAAAKEADALRDRVRELEEERQRRLTEPAEQSPPSQEFELKRRMDEARFDAQKAREDARGMLERAQKLIEELQQNRTQFETAQREKDRHWVEIQKLQAVFSGQPFSLVDESGPQPAAVGSAIRSAVQPDDAQIAEAAEAPAEHAPLNEELQALREEVHRLQEGIVRARAERDNAKSHLARIREELEETRRDLDAARDEARSHLNERDARIRELESALLQKQEECERLQTAQKNVSEEMASLQSQLNEGTDVIERLMELFGIAPEDQERIIAESEAARNQQLPEKNSSETPNDDIRADFGEGLRLVPRTGPALHHVEELRAGLGAPLPSALPPLDEDNDEPKFGRPPKTA